MSNFLCDMKEGDEIACQGPFGDFILARRCAIRSSSPPALASRPFAPCCTGCWRRNHATKRKQFWLLFGNRYEKDIYYHGEFLDLAASTRTFTICPLSAGAVADWHGLRGYVQEHVAELAQGRTDMHAYISGLDENDQSQS